MVEIIQNQTLQLLQQHCRSRVPFDVARYGQIMLRLGVIKQIGMEASNELEMMRTFGSDILETLEELMNRD